MNEIVELTEKDIKDLKILKTEEEFKEFVKMNTEFKKMKDMTTIEVVGFKEYQKRFVIKAVQMKKPFKVKCISGWSIGESGDWLAEQDDGMKFILKDDFFKLNYEIVKEPNKYEIKPVIMG